LIDSTEEQALATEKRKVLAETRADLLTRQLSNSENYDKAVLSLATAFLGLSLAFLKDIVSIERSDWVPLLYGSWISLGLAVLCTVVSFQVSQCAIDVQLRRAEDYYLRNDQSALSKSSLAKATEWINAASGTLFVLGVLLTIAFVIVNLERRLEVGSDSIQQGPRGATLPNKPQNAPLEKGAPIPNFQQVPQNAPPAQGSPPPTNNSPAGVNKK
jgi:hypothetical protein